MANMICGNCLVVDSPRRKAIDSSGTWFVIFLVVGLFVWPVLILAGLCFVLGVVRAIGRLGDVGVVYLCRRCKTPTMVPLDTPGGRALFERAKAPALPQQSYQPAAHYHHTPPPGPAVAPPPACPRCNGWLTPGGAFCAGCGCRLDGSAG